MTMLTKFPRTKLVIVGASVLATVAIWVALAWPEWTAGATAPDASTAGGVPAPEAAAAPPQKPVIVRRVYIIDRSSAPASRLPRGPAVTAPPPQFTRDQPLPSSPQQPQTHPQPITRSRGS